MYNKEPLELVESFEQLGLEIPSNYRWNECTTRHLEVGRERIMHLRTHAIMEKLIVGSSRNTFLTRWWHWCFSMGWKYVVASLNLLWKSLTKFLHVKKQTSYTLLRQYHFPLRSWPWKELLNTCLRNVLMPKTSLRTTRWKEMWPLMNVE